MTDHHLSVWSEPGKTRKLLKGIVVEILGMGFLIPLTFSDTLRLELGTPKWIFLYMRLYEMSAYSQRGAGDGIHATLKE